MVKERRDCFMTYQDAFNKAKEKFNNVKTDGFKGFFAIQVNLTDEDCGGIFYIEYKDATLSVEPYDYIDRTTVVTAARAELMKVLGGTAKAETAIEKGKIEVNGDVESFITLADALKAANKKPAAKKVVKKVAEKKEPAKKAAPAKKEVVKKAEPAKKAEPVKKTAPVKAEQIKLEIPEVKKTVAKKDTKKSK